MAGSKSSTNPDSARNRAQRFFSSTEKRDTEAKQTIENERAATDAKTAKLHALKLAKEAAEGISAENAVLQKSPTSRARKPRDKTA